MDNFPNVTRSMAAPRKKYDSEDSKRRLLRAAVNLFSKVGFDASTTRVIAKSAGVNESLIHRYFKNKQGLFFAVMREFHSSLMGSLPYEEGETVKEELTRFLEFRRDFGREHKKWMRLVITKAILDSKVRDEIGDLSRNGTPGLVERLQNLQSKGLLIPEVDVDQLSWLLTAISFSLVMFNDVIATWDRERADKVVELAVRLLADALSPK